MKYVKLAVPTPQYSTRWLKCWLFVEIASFSIAVCMGHRYFQKILLSELTLIGCCKSLPIFLLRMFFLLIFNMIFRSTSMVSSCKASRLEFCVGILQRLTTTVKNIDDLPSPSTSEKSWLSLAAQLGLAVLLHYQSLQEPDELDHAWQNLVTAWLMAWSELGIFLSTYLIQE